MVIFTYVESAFYGSTKVLFQHLRRKPVVADNEEGQSAL